MIKTPVGSGTALDPKRITVPKSPVSQVTLPTAEILAFPTPSGGEQTQQSQPISFAEPEKEGEGGKGGTETPFASITLSNRAFLENIFAELPAGAVALVTAKPGDPQAGPWLPHGAGEVEQVCHDDLNTYVNCSSFMPLEDGSFAATKAQAAAYHVLVLDDVGSKVDLANAEKLKPTWKIETSPGNYQMGYKLREPLREESAVKELQDRIAAAGLTDPGAKGMARWARLPNGINGKPKYRTAQGAAFSCKLLEWNENVTYTVAELFAAFSPVSLKKTSQLEAENLPSPTAEERARVYVPKVEGNPVVAALKGSGLYKSQLGGGKHDVTCPWVSEHTDALDTGACLRIPRSSRAVFRFDRARHSEVIARSVPRIVRAGFRGHRAQFEVWAA